MKRTLVSMLASLVIIAGIAFGQAMAQCPTKIIVPDGPDICVGLAILDAYGNPSNTFGQYDDLKVIVSLENVRDEIITAVPFKDRDFHLDLWFYDEDNNLIRAETNTGCPIRHRPCA